MTSPEPMPPVNLLMSALWWAAKGISVLPLHYPLDGVCSCRQADCSSPAKHPMAKLAGNGLTNATTDPDIVRDWWVQEPYANIGIRTGDVVDLIDIDSIDGLSAFAKIVELSGGMPTHLGVAQSGRNGFGQHIYVVPGGRKALQGGRTAPAGIDVKGRGGYAVAPPSLHISGRRYSWLANNFDKAELLGDVDWEAFYPRLTVRPIEPPRTPRPTTVIPNDAANAYGRAVLTRAVALIDTSTSGNRWQTLAVEAIPLVARGVDGGCIDRDSGIRELEDAARRVNLKPAEIARIAPLVDDMISKGIRHPIRPREAAATTSAAPASDYESEDEARADPWEPPWPLRYPTPPFPIEILGWVRPAVEGLAHQLQCPIDLVAMMTLAAVAATIRGRIRAQFIDDWEEPLNLYVAAVLGPGETKSPALARIIAPLREMETEARAATKERIAATTFDKDMLDERARRLRDTAIKYTGNDNYELMRVQNDAREAALAADKVTVPVMPLWLAGDMTPEALVAKLAEQGGTLAHLSAEGELLDTIVGGRYSSGAPHLSSLLTAHDGREPVRVHRKSAPDIEVERPCLTLGLAVQPQVLEAMGGVDAAVRRGLAARFLFSIPESLVGRRNMTAKRGGDTAKAFDALLRGVDRIATLPEGSGDIGPSIRGSEGDGWHAHDQGFGDIRPSFSIYGFQESSSSLVTHYRETLEPRRAAQTGDLGEIGPWANKLDGQIIRLSTVLQLIHDADPAATNPGSRAQNPSNIGAVGVDATSSALVLADYLIAHAIEAHAVMGGTEHGAEYQRAKQLLGWIRAGNQHEFTAHDAERSLRKRVTFRDQGAVHEACSTLSRLGWIRYVPPVEGKPGRPSTRYLVHPEVFA